MRRPLEHNIHIGVAQLLKLNAAPGVVWFHPPNGEYRSPRTAGKLAAMGIRAGVADFCLLIPCKITQFYQVAQPAFLELKRPGGRLSVAQEQFRDDVTAIGCLWALAYSTDQAADFLRQWGALRSNQSARAA